jgi:outer membrane protein assembly factor BamB
MRAWIVTAAVAAALACVAPCAAAPTGVEGWPVRTPAGPVLQGPGGGAVVVNQGVLDAFVYTVSAYRLDGRRLWANRKRASCGNCDEGTQPARRQADGTYGLIGVTGDDFWSVTQQGRRVGGCTGAVLPDGTCIATTFRLVPPGFEPENSLVSRRGGAVLWSVVEPGLGDWFPESNVAPYVVRDGAGNVYAAYGQGFPSARFVVVDGTTGGVRARVPGSLDFVAATAEAGLALEGSALVAVGPDGVRRWSAPIGRPFIFPQDVIVDRARQRAYVGRRERNRWSTTAFDTGDGSVVWRSAAGHSVRPLSLAQGGLLLVGFAQGGTRAVRALGLDGRPRWTFRTAFPVVGARELTGRTVVASTDRGDATGPLWRVRPG